MLNKNQIFIESPTMMKNYELPEDGNEMNEENINAVVSK